MKLFEFAWTWYEDYVPYLFYHKKKTHAEFREDMRAMMIKYGPAYIKQERSWVGAPGWMEFVVGHLSEIGYERVVPESYNIRGAYIIEGRKDNDDFDKVVGEELMTLACAHNRKIRRNMYARIDSSSRDKEQFVHNDDRKAGETSGSDSRAVQDKPARVHKGGLGTRVHNVAGKIRRPARSKTNRN
jgi:hypothetical protein